MRDIGRRIQSYRLARYASARRVTIPRWVWLAIAAWLAWAGLVSDHSFYQLWRLERASGREHQTLRRAEDELRNYERLSKDTKAQEREAETHLREDEGWSRPDEILFRIDGHRESAPAPVVPPKQRDAR